MAAAALFNRLIDLDEAVSLSLHARFGAFVPRSLLHALEYVADDLFWFAAVSSLLLLSLAARSAAAPFLLAFLAGSLLDLFLAGLIKHLVRRPRPVHGGPRPPTAFAADQWSFPSAHASRGFFAATFAHLCGARLGAAVFLWSATTSASRVMLGRHFALDVLGGALVGVVEGWFVFRTMVLTAAYLSPPA